MGQLAHIAVPAGANRGRSRLRMTIYVTVRNPTEGNVTMKSASTELCDFERQVMQLMWNYDRLTADALRELPVQHRARQLKDSTVRT